ncbi:hypothetical protein HANVADRAFT_51525 [Hanseniaspora valbyensis NRRL Y-1626]|uniref:Mediator of RNA polymerase II transcription subunit 10 n=1 Tax=Hanseniaspora valbyensis NRRL Y-1626 TaxID=766949 RepID=A0A1B7THH9_9ASCO|nr:hypothetical protein HANVADRAFT_51525 [Hanseniaspora valbyensis NRRL Y-1626]
MTDTLSLTEHKIKDLIEIFIELNLTVYDYSNTEDTQNSILNNLNKIFTNLKDLNTASFELANDKSETSQNMNIPLDVIQYIESTRNPDVYTREFVESIKLANDYQREKQSALKYMSLKLGEGIIEAFGEEEEEEDDDDDKQKIKEAVESIWNRGNIIKEEEAKKKKKKKKI